MKGRATKCDYFCAEIADRGNKKPADDLYSARRQGLGFNPSPIAHDLSPVVISFTSICVLQINNLQVYHHYDIIMIV